MSQHRAATCARSIPHRGAPRIAPPSRSVRSRSQGMHARRGGPRAVHRRTRGSSAPAPACPPRLPGTGSPSMPRRSTPTRPSWASRRGTSCAGSGAGSCTGAGTRRRSTPRSPRSSSPSSARPPSRSSSPRSPATSSPHVPGLRDGPRVASCAPHRWAAFVAVLPLVFTSSPLHTYILSPPRQAALTARVRGALRQRRGQPPHVDSRGGARRSTPLRVRRSASLACFADPYAPAVPAAAHSSSVVAAAASVTAVSVARAPTQRASSRAPLGATLLGATLGLIPFAALLHSPRSVHGETTLTLSVLRHNASLLADPCLPWLLGTTAYVPHALLGYAPWESGAGALSHALGASVRRVSSWLAIADRWRLLFRRQKHPPRPVRRLARRSASRSSPCSPSPRSWCR